MVSTTNSQPLSIFLSDSKPSVKRVIKLRIFFQNVILRMMNKRRTVIAAMESSIIAHPPIEVNIPPPDVLNPLSPTNVQKTFHCISTAAMVMRMTISVSMSLSETSVPSDWANGILSCCSRITHLETSPMRGTTRLAAYATNIEYMLTDVVGRIPSGARVSFQRHPRITWLITPKKVDSANQKRSIPLNEIHSCEMSRSSYIMYRISIPSINGNNVFNVIFKIFFTTIENF